MLLAMVLGSVAASSAGHSVGDPISLREVTYTDLGKAIRALKGKVVVVDFWATY
jgi:hypothetical protein